MVINKRVQKLKAAGGKGETVTSIKGELQRVARQALVLFSDVLQNEALARVELEGKKKKKEPLATKSQTAALDCELHSSRK